MRIVADWLAAPDVQRLMRALNGAGYPTYFVGGCVRNALLGLPITDVDLATAALPDMVTKTARGLGLRVIPTGVDHGTVTAFAGGTSYEITTFRRDVATDGRHAQVAFSQNLADDAARRDFTINALYADVDGAVIDPLGGLADIALRRVAFVGAPAARITEDYLRILRYFRFHAIYSSPDHGFDAEALAACAAYAPEIPRLSRERIGQEMRKLLGAPDPAPAVAAMAAAGALGYVLPHSDARFLAPLVHLEAGQPLPWLARLAILGGEDAGAALRLSRREAADLRAIRAGLGSAQTPAALGYVHGAGLAACIVHGRAAMFGTDLPHAWQGDVARGAVAVCPVSAADFMPALQGPALGAALARAVQAWLASDLRASKADLLKS